MRSRTVLSALALLGAAAAQADHTVTSTYTYALTEDVGTAFIRDLEFKEDGGYVGAPGQGWGLSTSFYNNSTGGENNNANTLTVVNDSFHGTPQPYLTRSLFFGIIQGLPTDASPDQKHLVLFMDPTSAANVQNRAFGSVFPDTSEDGLIGAIEYVHSDAHTDAEKASYYDDVIHPFYDAALNAYAGSNPTPQRSVWFGAGSAFSIVTFSDGKTIGGGTSTVSVVPEPASLAALGLGAAALLRRRRR